MFRFLRFLVILLLLYLSWPFLQKQFTGTNFHTALESFRSEWEQLSANTDWKAKINSILAEFQHSVDQQGESPKKQEAPVKKMPLTQPAHQFFSVGNVEIGDAKTDAERHLGFAKRSTMSEYGKKWFAYHDHYHNFAMAMYDRNERVVGLYTDQGLIASKSGIKLGSSKSYVRAKLGQPMDGIQKGMVIYKLENKGEYDRFQLSGMYATVFYDKHEGNTVTAILLLAKNVEQEKKDIYTKASSTLMNGFEQQLFDLTNSSRVNHHLPVLEWDTNVRMTARKHSSDMAVHHYFNHIDLHGYSPFDRMEADHIHFHLAGENIAYGQFSSIFAHEGLMNSLGHRENILRHGYEFLGVGVAFNDQSQPYYTENFYAK